MNISLAILTLNITTRTSHKVGESGIPQINSVKGCVLDFLCEDSS
jgi:hypothetical protein